MVAKIAILCNLPAQCGAFGDFRAIRGIRPASALLDRTNRRITMSVSLGFCWPSLFPFQGPASGLDLRLHTPLWTPALRALFLMQPRRQNYGTMAFPQDPGVLLQLLDREIPKGLAHLADPAETQSPTLRWRTAIQAHRKLCRSPPDGCCYKKQRSTPHRARPTLYDTIRTQCGAWCELL